MAVMDALRGGFLVQEARQDLWDAMLDMYEKYGYYREGLETKTLKGIDGAAQIQSMMSEYRTNRRRSWAVIRYWQYATTRRTPEGSFYR